jgi:hypothetical protein
MKLPILILGPMCSGKTTVSKLLSKRLGLPRYPLDSLRWYYYAKGGMDFNKDDELKTGDFGILIKSRKPYDLLAIKNAIKDFPHGIIDFGATNSFWKDRNELEQVLEIVKNIENIFLLLPNEDVDRNTEVLNSRLEKRDKSKDIERLKAINKEMIECKSQLKIAKFIIYTEGKTPDRIVNEIIAESGILHN